MRCATARNAADALPMSDTLPVKKPKRPYVPVSVPTGENAAFGWPRWRQWIDMMFVDHGIFRLFFNTRTRVADGAYRSSQPWPHQIRAAARLGVKTILNLRADRVCGAYALEMREAERLGLTVHNVRISSRNAPRVELLVALDQLFRTMQKPVLLHCKSGADRAGIVAVLYLIMAEGKRVAEARPHLSMRYGHMKAGAQGALDAFLDAFEREGEAKGLSVLQWAQSAYDPAAIDHAFRARRRFGWLSDFFIRRE